MTMPASVLILGQRFTLERVSAAVLRDGDGTRVGNLRMGKQSIVVSEELASDQERDTVLHETLHAVCGVIGVFKRDAEEERVVGTLTPVLLDVLRRNPDLVGYLTEAA